MLDTGFDDPFENGHSVFWHKLFECHKKSGLKGNGALDFSPANGASAYVRPSSAWGLRWIIVSGDGEQGDIK